eukprot:Amastigsp_a176093_155.p2 type:complete len:114 gc:universal Amastigsp_a176093_155:1104-1445(+)
MLAKPCVHGRCTAFERPNDHPVRSAEPGCIVVYEAVRIVGVHSSYTAHNCVSILLPKITDVTSGLLLERRQPSRRRSDRARCHDDSDLCRSKHRRRVHTLLFLLNMECEEDYT